MANHSVAYTDVGKAYPSGKLCLHCHQDSFLSIRTTALKLCQLISGLFEEFLTYFKIGSRVMALVFWKSFTLMDKHIVRDTVFYKHNFKVSHHLL